MRELDRISDGLVRGDKIAVAASVRNALAAGVEPAKILSRGLIPGMDIVGRKFRANEFFLPEVLVAAKAMHEGLGILRPALARTGVRPVGRAVIGTVKGDIHDIGKNLVGMMLQGAGLEVVDLGTDVAPDRFAEEAIRHQADLVCLSALLTTTMAEMPRAIRVLKERGVAPKTKVLIGGAPITERYAREVGADGYAPDAASAVAVARSLVGAGEPAGRKQPHGGSDRARKKRGRGKR